MEQSDRLDKQITVYEVGTGEFRLLSDSVKFIHQLCGGRTELNFGAIPYREGEIMKSQADTAPLEWLGWSSRVSFEEGIMKTIRAEKCRKRLKEEFDR